MSDFETIAQTADIPANRNLAVEHRGLRLLVCNSGGEFVVVENRCSHQDQPLERGRIRNGYIICPVHGMRFKLENGEPVGQLTRVPIRLFESRVTDDAVQLCAAPRDQPTIAKITTNTNGKPRK